MHSVQFMYIQVACKINVNFCYFQDWLRYRKGCQASKLHQLLYRFNKVNLELHWQNSPVALTNLGFLTMLEFICNRSLMPFFTLLWISPLSGILSPNCFSSVAYHKLKRIYFVSVGIVLFREWRAVAKRNKDQREYFEVR